MQLIRKYLSSAWQALFGDPVRAFGVVSLILLLALAIAPAKEHFSQWHSYQRNYLALIRDRGDAVSLRRRFEPGIHQIWLPELGVVDRCTTCHLGLNEASLADVTQQPFRKHPVIPHSLDGFGCVICHGGQGQATTVAEAHHSERAGEEPILPTRYIESGCGQCHQNALPGTPQLNLGRTMLTRYGCVHCHAITRPDGSKMEATDHPPSLAHIADKTTREWIFSWLKDPQAYAASTTMPNYKLSDADASDISAYLVSSSTPHAGDTAAAERQARGDCRSSRGTKPLWRIVLRLLPRRSECGGQPGGRRSGPGTDAHRQQGKARVAGGMASESPRLRCHHAHAALPLHAAADRHAGCVPAEQSRIPTTARAFIWMRPTRSRLPTDASSSLSWDARHATRSTACRSRRTSRPNSAPSAASRWRRSSSCRAWSTRCPATSRPRFASRAPSAPASRCRSSPSPLRRPMR